MQKDKRTPHLFDLLKLNEKVALVTGAGRGLGKAIALALADAGSDLICIGRTKAQIEETCAEAEKTGRKAIAVPTDVTSSESVNKMCLHGLAEFGRIDILVNNAGFAIEKPFCEISDEEWDRVINTNLRGAFYCTRAVGRQMIERREGKIINISSIMGIRGYQNFASYCVSKAGIIQLTRTLALEWARYKIHVNAIAPGIFLTSFNERAFTNEQIRDMVLKRIPFRRFGQPEELGGLVVYLASKASDYITGEVIVFDGGQQVNW